MIPPKTKICTKCRKRKKLEEFFRNKVAKYGRENICQECYLKRQSKRYHSDPKFRENFLKKGKKLYLQSKKYSLKVVGKLLRYPKDTSK